MHEGITASKGRIELWKESIQRYKDTIFGMYGSYPSEKLIEAHCKIYNIPYPLPRLEDIETKEEFDFLE